MRLLFNTKNLLSLILTAAIVITLLALCLSFFARDTRKISPFSFSCGSLDNSGRFKKSDTSIYTKNLIECQGLSVTVDFEANLTYQIFFYGEDKSFIGKTDVLSKDYTKTDFENAKYARIVITPVLEEGIKEIHFYESFVYARYITVKVDKEQNFEASDETLFSETNSISYAA